MIDIKDLEAFVAILDGGSISKAATDLGLTQPALSLKLKKMETELGIRLFQRTPRSVIPLESARAIEGKVRDIISRLDVLKESLASSLAELKGTVRIGCVLGWFDTILVPTLQQVSQTNPALRLKLHMDQVPNLVPMLSYGQLDMAIVAQPFESADGIDGEKLLDEELVLVGQHLPKAANESERKKLLLKRPWITMTVPDPLVEKYWHEQFNESFPWNEILIPASIDKISAIPTVLKSLPDTVAVLPKQVVSESAARGELEVAQAIPHKNGLYLLWREDSLQLARYRLMRDLIVKNAKAYLVRK